jgi:formiminotetrahydrofolate cyclodeaminase
MPGLADRSLEELLDELAAQRPAPGGGSAAAWGCALGAALVEMSAAFTLAQERYEQLHRRARAIHGRAGELRREAVALGERELTSYAPVLDALRARPGEPGREERLAEARARASDAPLATARVAAEVAELGAELARTGNRHLEGDAAAGTLLAEAACGAAARLVALNLAEHPDRSRIAEADELTRRAASARKGALP